MIKTIQQTWHITYSNDPEPSVCITRKENDVTLNRHDFTLSTIRELIKELQKALNKAEGA